MKKLVKFFLLPCYLTFLAPIFAEYVSFPSTHFFTLDSSNLVDTQYSINLDDALIIKISEEIPLLKGLDVEVTQGNSRALSFMLYSFLQEPKESETKYSIKEIVRESLPQKKTFTLRFSYDENSRFSLDATIKYIPHYLNEKNSPLLLKLSKQGTQKDDDKKILVKFKPIIQDVGGIKFNLLYPTIQSLNSDSSNDQERKNVAIRVDNNYVKDFSKPFMTRIGQHRIQVDSHFYKSEVITCVVEKGKIESIDIALKPLAPLLTIVAPIGTEAYIDDALIKLPFYFSVKSGEHVFRFKINDYEIVRNIKLEDGKSYAINLCLEITVVEQ